MGNTITFGVKEIMSALMNPILIYEYILDMDLPDEFTPYTNTIFSTFNELFNAIYQFDLYKDDLQHILDKHELTEDQLAILSKSRNMKMKLFLQLMDSIEGDVTQLQKKICETVRQYPTVTHLKVLMRKLLLNVEFRSTHLFSEAKVYFKNNKNRVDNESLTLITELFVRMMNTTIMTLMMDMKDEAKETITTEKEVAAGMSKEVEYYKDPDTGAIHLDVVEKDTIQHVDKEKMKEKQLRVQVNEMDSESGCKLKKPVETIDDETTFLQVINEYKMKMTKVVNKMNGLKKDKFITENEIFGNVVESPLKMSKIKEASKYFDDKEYGMDSKEFKSRFTTYILTWAINNLKDIVDFCYEHNNDGQFIEYEVKFDYVKNIYKKSKELAKSIANDEEYGDTFLFFMELMNYIDSDGKLEKQEKKMNNIYEQTKWISEKLPPSWLRNEEDGIMDTICKMGFLSATESTNSKNAVTFRDYYRFKNMDETESLLKELGIFISKKWEKHGQPRMFRWFVKSKPLIMAKNPSVNEDKDVLIGALSIYYYAFVSGNKKIQKLVYDII